MTTHTLATSLAVLAALVGAQNVGTNLAEHHPPLPYQKCTASGCSTQSTGIVLDANWRWVHSNTGYTNCYTGNTWDKTLCPDGSTCIKNCALDGADYSGTYGITTSGNALTLKLKTGNNIGTRTYLINRSNKYEIFKLKNMEFSFDVDASKLGCGLNGALYFTAMDADGGMAKNSNNKAGAAYGTGYCDAQCPQDLKLIGNLANVAGWKGSTDDPNSGTGNLGSCCSEMDIWEGNSISEALTPHPCSIVGQSTCTSPQTCGSGDGNRYAGTCDKDGCDFNPFRWGNHSFYGPNKLVNSNQKLTVVTQFITNDHTATGTLTAIRRLYVQNGKVIHQSNTNVAGITGTNQITDNFCTQQKKVTGDTNSFGSKGGLAQMGKAFDQGMVLVMSVWDDHAAHMLWLDSQYPVTANPSSPGITRGTCDTTSGKPSDVERQQSNAQVIFSNIKFGTMGSTYAH